MDKLDDEKLIEVCDIPAGTSRDRLVMILESARHTGVAGVTVEALEFLAEDQSRAIVTLSTAGGMFIAFCCVLLRVCKVQYIFNISHDSQTVFIDTQFCYC